MNVRFPIGELEVPNKVTLEDIQKWLSEIESYAYRLRQTVAHLNDEALNKQYRDKSWTVRQLVHHIADSQLNMFQRLKLALTDTNPVVDPFIQDEWAKLADSQLPIECSLKMLEGINERIIAIGNHLTESDLNRTFTLRGSREISVATKVAKLAWHEEHHLAHIKIALS
ncbi:putative metal-dependent hydrolase [Staphylococcus cohnii]|uniref:YfiT family bacillithiol transferase n=1 Tax=Staphylococcus cohnii TaxID=29382 RepID=UPI001CCFFEB8|nr:putative metal-dependent hydrolase [Staphylococcus cohnii]MBZ8173135.1 putative metal-dependent hydrolase [Staphylococcus cohnii]